MEEINSSISSRGDELQKYNFWKNEICSEYARSKVPGGYRFSPEIGRMSGPRRILANWKNFPKNAIYLVYNFV